MTKTTHFFAAVSSGYNYHGNLDHGYTTIGYLDINIKNNI
jgi:hypothetical protein